MADHIIQPGQTLSQIAKQYGVTVKQLQDANGIKNPNLIFAGKSLKIPIESDKAFDIPGMSVERGCEVRSWFETPDNYITDKPDYKLVYAHIIVDPKDKDENGGARSLYAYYPPKDDEGGARSLYAYYPPKDGKEPAPEPMYAYVPGKDDKPGIVPMYAYFPSSGNTTTPGLTLPGITIPGLSLPVISTPENTTPDIKIPFRPGYTPPETTTPGQSTPGQVNPEPVQTTPGQSTPGQVNPEPVQTTPGQSTPGQVNPEPVQTTPGQSTPDATTPEQVDPTKPRKVNARATAKDIELLKRRGADLNTNNPSASAQFVLGDEDGEVAITGENEAQPDTITIKDNTNGKVNTYTYRKLYRDEIEAGKTKDGQPINKEAYQNNQYGYYILVSVEDKDGNLRASKHPEVFRLDYIPGDDSNPTSSYNLVQEHGMDGSDKSSMDYSKRKTR